MILRPCSAGVCPQIAVPWICRHLWNRSRQSCVGVFVVIIKVDKNRGPVVEVEPQENPFLVSQFVRRKGKGRGHTGSQSIAAAFSLNIRICVEKRRKDRNACSCLSSQRFAAYQKRHIAFHCCDPLLQSVRIIRHHLDDGVHIIKVFSFAVHSLFQEQPSADGVASSSKSWRRSPTSRILERLTMVV